MKALNRICFSAGIAGLMLVGSATAGQVAQFTELNGTQDFSWTRSGLQTTISGSSQINFVFSNTLIPNPRPGNISATLLLQAVTTTPGTDDGSVINENGFNGSFSIKANGDNTNLLSGVFGFHGAPAATWTGSTGGASSSFQDATPPAGEVIFTSAYIDFTVSTITQAFGFSFSNNVPGNKIFPLGPGAGFLDSATAVGTGTFSAQPLPTVLGPEPATLAMLGSALIALGLLGRKRLSR